MHETIPRARLHFSRSSFTPEILGSGREPSLLACLQGSKDTRSYLCSYAPTASPLSGSELRAGKNRAQVRCFISECFQNRMVCGWFWDARFSGVKEQDQLHGCTACVVTQKGPELGYCSAITGLKFFIVSEKAPRAVWLLLRRRLLCHRVL